MSGEIRSIQATGMKYQFFTLLTATGFWISLLAMPFDALAQRVINVNPDINAENVTPDASIYGQFETDDSTAIDVSSVEIYVNGDEVTDRSTITPTFFSYRPLQALPSGPVTIRVEFEDAEGVRRVVRWSFTVQQPRAALEISSITHNAAGTLLGPDATLLVTMNGTPGADGSVLLVEDGETVRELDTQETSRGVYVARLTVAEGDRVDEGVVVGRLANQGQVTYAVASQPVAFNPSAVGIVAAPETVEDNTDELTSTESGATAAMSLKPTFTSHDDGDAVRGRSFTIAGTTRPNASVDLNVTATASVLGLVNFGGTIVERTLTADDEGEFELQVSVPRIATAGTEYTIRAIARSDSETSEPTEITLTQE
jgi:hypothetical protein